MFVCFYSLNDLIEEVKAMYNVRRLRREMGSVTDGPVDLFLELWKVLW